MSTEDMPTTNQGSDYKTLADKIPPSVADGFDMAANSMKNQIVGEIKKGSNTMSNA